MPNFNYNYGDWLSNDKGDNLFPVLSDMKEAIHLIKEKKRLGNNLSIIVDTSPFEGADGKLTIFDTGRITTCYIWKKSFLQWKVIGLCHKGLEGTFGHIPKIIYFRVDNQSGI